MTDKQKSFEDLVNEAPLASAAGTVSLIGTLARSREAGKFVLTVQGGNAVTFETAFVKGHAVLGTSVGRMIVRIDIDPANAPLEHTFTPPCNEIGVEVQAGGLIPFALATPHQVPASTLTAMQKLVNAALLT